MKTLFKPAVAPVAAINSCQIGIVLSAFTILGIATVQPVEAAMLDVFNPTISGTSVYGPEGKLGDAPTLITQEALLPSDILNMTASGIVGLDNTAGYNTNAAGVIVSPQTTNTGNHPGDVVTMAGTNIPFGALEIGNDDIGFYKVFPPTPANGAGNPNAPTTLSLSAPLSSIFTSSTFQGLAKGTPLEFRVGDINTIGNSGYFTGTFSITSNRIPVTSSQPDPSAPLPAQSVPEPSAAPELLGLGLLGAGSLVIRRQRQLAQGKV
jgi:hypothetical protein